VTSDNGSIVLGWLTRLVLVVAGLGLIGFDGVALVKTNFTAADHASTAATAGADTYRQTKNVQQAYDAAVAAVPGDTIDPNKFVVNPTTGTVKLTVTEQAVTLWVYRISPLKKYTIVHASAESTSSP
jgi:hypothetical protein